MAKKELNEDLLTGGSLGGEDKKAAKEAAKKAKKLAKEQKVKEKNEAKRAAIKAEIDKLKEKRAASESEKEKEELSKKIKALSDKYSSVGSGASINISKRTKKAIQSVVCVVIVVALLATYFCTGAVRKGFISYTGLPAKATTAVTVTNGTQKANVKVETYNFYFASTYNTLQSQQSTYEQYGISLEDAGLNVDFSKELSKQEYVDEDNKTITWAEHIQDLVVEAIEDTYTYYLAAVEANDGKEPEITDEQKQELEDTLKQYEEQANQYGYTLSGYLVKAMGKGVTEKVFTRELTRQYIAQNYQEQLSDPSSREYTDEDINAYKDEHLDDLKTVDVKIFECDNEDNAKSFKKELKADGSNFADLCVKYSTSDFEKEGYEDEGYSTIYGVTREFLINNAYAIAAAVEEEDHDEKAEGEEHNHSYPGLDWLFGNRKAGDIYQDGTTVVYVIKPASLSDRKTVNVRHILIKPDSESDDQSSATEKQWNDAYAKAKSILKEWKSGDKTEDSFAALVKDNSADTGSVDNGGLYENVITCKMVNSFSYWCFDSSRKAGDTAIVRTDFGYHIMYFVGTNDQKIWQYSAEEALASSDGSDDVEKLEKEYTAKVNWFGSRYFEKDVDISH
ncbi:MAG: peptidylprolyl isomerase [Eubacterium sp.]